MPPSLDFGSFSPSLSPLPPDLLMGLVDSPTVCRACHLDLASKVQSSTDFGTKQCLVELFRDGHDMSGKRLTP